MITYQFPSDIKLIEFLHCKLKVHIFGNHKGVGASDLRRNLLLLLSNPGNPARCTCFRGFTKKVFISEQKLDKQNELEYILHLSSS
jgi:hypothetical protein